MKAAVLDLDPTREGAPPRDAATLVVTRDGPGGVEVFCVERRKVGFLGGAVVFPGGKVDESDRDEGWIDCVTPPRVEAMRAFCIAACREAFEEAALLPAAGGSLSGEELLDWRARAARRETTLRALLSARALKLDLARCHPLARWVTPVAESRRFDARFFLHVARAAQEGAHDGHETTASFWAAPRHVLRRFAAGDLQLAPPTHRVLEMLADARDTHDAVAVAHAACLDPICPKLVAHRDAGGETIALTLPGDPEHDVRQPRAPGKSRYVLRGDRFVPEDPPA